MSKAKPKAKSSAKEQVLCPQCRSPRRSKYHSIQRQDYAGAGLPFVAIIYKRCECLDCGQSRVEREYERE